MGKIIDRDIIERLEQEKDIDITITSLGQELANEKIKNIEKGNVINELGQELTKLKLQIIGQGDE